MNKSLTNRKMMMGKSNKSKKDDYTWVWILIAVILVMLLLGVCWCNGDSNDTFANTVTSGFKNTLSKLGMGKSNAALKELDVIYFMSPKCPWCQKMNAVIDKEGVKGDLTIIDVTTPNGQKMATKMGAASKGIPAFISKKNKTGTVGFKKSANEIVASLSKMPAQSSAPVPTGPATDEMIQTINNLQIVVFVSPSCGWCGKMKKELADSGCMDVVELVDVSNPEGQHMAKELLSEMRGVPACYSRATGKKTSGYKPIMKIIEELS